MTYIVFGGTLNLAQPTTYLPKAVTNFSLISGNSYKLYLGFTIISFEVSF